MITNQLRRVRPSRNLVPPSTYAWLITVDHLYQQQASVPGNLITQRNDRGTSGPSNAPDCLLERLKAGEGEAFKMFDDDGELYYEGLIIGEYDGLEPLDDFGKPNAGATDIQFCKEGAFTSL